MESIQEYINNHVLADQPFSKIDTMPFPTYKKRFKKNEVITRFGQLEKQAYYLVDGIIESTLNKEGDVRIIDFVFPGQFICSYASYLLQTPSDIQTIALTDCEVEYFYKSDLDNAYKSSLVANQFGRHVIENFFIAKLNRVNTFLTKSASEAYNELICKQPEVLEKIPVNKIARYLGIHPESLSRIRAEALLGAD